MKHSKFKVYYYYHNINLWKTKSIDTLSKKKWIFLKNKSLVGKNNKLYSIGKYICHYKKLNITRLYYFKFINKQILKKYFVNYKEYNFKNNFISNLYNLERRLDFNLYKANFVVSLYEARFCITKGFIYVNKKRITNFSYLLQTNDIVELHPFLYNYILKNRKFNNINLYYYLRNLEIDYKTLSFVFLNKKDYFIINYNNFVKKNYFKSNNKIYLFSNNNIQLYNNFYKFFDTIYNNYLFLNKQNKILGKNKYINSYKANLLLKFIKYKYNDYYFRNILLKSTFNLKYNYLRKLDKNNFFQNYNFANIDYLYNSLFNIENKNNINNLLNNQFFQYYYNIIFNYYIYTLKNYSNKNNKIINYDQILNLSYIYLKKKFSINNYNYYILLNYKFFKLLNIRTKLNYYYNNKLLLNENYNFKFSKNLNFTNKNTFKKIDYKTISQNYNSKYHYNNIKLYKYLITYISSYKFGYKIYKRCRNFQQNYIKRTRIIKRIQKSFYYTRFNCNRYGIYLKKITKRVLYNQLKTNYIKINNNISNDINLNKFKITKQNLISNKKIVTTTNKLVSIYYPKNNIIYKSIYNPLISNYKNNIVILKENIKHINFLNQQFKNLNISSDLNNYLIKLEKQMYYKIKIIQNNFKSDYNFNKNYKNIYLLINLINFYNNIVINNNIIPLSTLNTNVLYRMHDVINLNYNKILKNKNKKYYVKKYKRFVNDYRRFQLNSYYIFYNKTKLANVSNLKSYFLKNNYNNSNLKLFYNFYYSNILINDNNSIYKNFYKKNKRNLFRINHRNFNRKIFNIYKSQYILKRQAFNLNIDNNEIINFSNMNIINNNNLFNDNLFLIDLVLNLTIRKFNLTYNKFMYKAFNFNIKDMTLNTFKVYKKNLKLNNNLIKRNNKKFKNTKFIYKAYVLKNYTNIYNTKYKNIIFNNYKIRINTSFKTNYYQNKLIYNYNNIYNNLKINKQLFKYYYGYFNYKNKQQNKKIFIKINKQNYINNIYKIYTYYIFNIRKYNIIKYIYKNYIYKEYNSFLEKIITSVNIKKIDKNYIKKLYYNLLFTKLFNITTFDYTLKNNYNYSKNLRIIINYFIIINRLYK